ncbi:hypothetical protein Salat_1161000 [Sesamum alatum]|uniref:Uncharacterized protein n=1 Tax=Sesamum alatum TaxID=300844 RepID=A0AAE2CNF8_9LAMI|nr:hypothetical protein Salat_1161000 [Sesamum alatum]
MDFPLHPPPPANSRCAKAPLRPPESLPTTVSSPSSSNQTLNPSNRKEPEQPAETSSSQPVSAPPNQSFEQRLLASSQHFSPDRHATNSHIVEENIDYSNDWNY